MELMGFPLFKEEDNPSTVWDWSEENKTRSGIRMKEGDMAENNA